MKKFRVEFEANPCYEVEAETADEAIEKAFDYFYNYEPAVDIEEIKDEKNT